MDEVCTRPFYTEFAWAFDLLIDRPVQKESMFIAAWLADRGVFPGATLLDAGCGTGRYAVELARRGYVVEGIDRSPDLIDVAKAASIGAKAAYRSRWARSLTCRSASTTGFSVGAS